MLEAVHTADLDRRSVVFQTTAAEHAFKQARIEDMRRGDTRTCLEGGFSRVHSYVASCAKQAGVFRFTPAKNLCRDTRKLTRGRGRLRFSHVGFAGVAMGLKTS